jgi:hypothetical protein
MRLIGRLLKDKGIKPGSKRADKLNVSSLTWAVGVSNLRA